MPPSKEEHLVSTDRVLESVKAFRKLRQLELSKKDRKFLLADTERELKNVNLQLTVKKMSANQRILMVPFKFPNSLIQESDEVCFIVGCKEEDKNNRRADHERYANEWKHKLRQMGIEREIHVLPIMQLETEFKPFEAKRKLCKAFEHFICDHRIMPRMPQLLGTMFFRRRKMPIRVYMRDENILKETILSAIDRVLIHVTPEGPNVSMKVGNLEDHTDAEIAENIRAILDVFIPEHLPGADANVNSIHVASFSGKSIPMYISLVSANQVDMSAVDKKFIEKQTPTEVEDTIDTISGIRVKVRSDGKVTAVKDDNEKVEVDDVLDEDYLDVFREQTFEESAESKKRFVKHLARKGALRKLGKRFGPNMLKLPNAANPPKPIATSKPLPTQKVKSKPPAVPQVLDALKGFDESGDEDSEPLSKKSPKAKKQKVQHDSDDEVPTLVPITPKNASASKKSLKKLGRNSQTLASTTEFTTAKQKKLSVAGTPGVKTPRKSTTEFTQSVNVTPMSQKKSKKDSFVVKSQTKEQATPKFVNAPGVEVTRSAKKTPGSLKKKTPSKNAQELKPILKTPQQSLGKDRRKSVTFDCEQSTPGLAEILQTTLSAKSSRKRPRKSTGTPEPKALFLKKRMKTQ